MFGIGKPPAQPKSGGSEGGHGEDLPPFAQSAQKISNHPIVPYKVPPQEDLPTDPGEIPDSMILEKFREFKKEGIGIPIIMGGKERAYLLRMIKMGNGDRKIPYLILITDAGVMLSLRASYPEVFTATPASYEKALELCDSKGKPINLPSTTKPADLEKKFTTPILDGGFGFAIVNRADKGEFACETVTGEYLEVLNDEQRRAKERLIKVRTSGVRFINTTNDFSHPDK